MFLFCCRNERQYLFLEHIATYYAVVEVIGGVERVAVVYGVAAPVEQRLYRLAVHREVPRRRFHADENVLQLVPTVFPLLYAHLSVPRLGVWRLDAAA